MDRLTPQQRSQIVEIYFQHRSSVRETYRALRGIYGRHKRPSECAIYHIIKKFRTQSTLSETHTPTRKKTVRSEENIAAVEASVELDPNLSIRQRSQQLGLCPSTIWKILRTDLGVAAGEKKVKKSTTGEKRVAAETKRPTEMKKVETSTAKNTEKTGSTKVAVTKPKVPKVKITVAKLKKAAAPI